MSYVVVRLASILRALKLKQTEQVNPFDIHSCFVPFVLTGSVNKSPFFVAIVTWNWGSFINSVIYLLLVGFFLFIMVKRKLYIAGKKHGMSIYTSATVIH